MGGVPNTFRMLNNTFQTGCKALANVWNITLLAGETVVYQKANMHDFCLPQGSAKGHQRLVDCPADTRVKDLSINSVAKRTNCFPRDPVQSFWMACTHGTHLGNRLHDLIVAVIH
jgi:hypothetical protein